MESEHQPKLSPVRAFQVLHGCNPDPEETYTSLSEYHDYEPSLEFDDSELIHTSGLAPLPPELLDIPDDLLAHSASDGTIEENFEEELATAPEVYAEISSSLDDFAELNGTGLVEVVGDDEVGRRIIVVSACRLPPSKDLLPDKLLRYLMFTLDKYVEQDYSVVYFHCGLTSKNKPPLSWLWKAYKAFDRKYKKNLKALYLVHPTNFIRIVWQMLRPAISVKFGRKMMYVNYLHELQQYLNLDKLCIPDAVLDQANFPTAVDNLDITLNQSASSSSKEIQNQATIPIITIEEMEAFKQDEAAPTTDEKLLMKQNQPNIPIVMNKETQDQAAIPTVTVEDMEYIDEDQLATPLIIVEDNEDIGQDEAAAFPLSLEKFDIKKDQEVTKYLTVEDYYNLMRADRLAFLLMCSDAFQHSLEKFDMKKDQEGTKYLTVEDYYNLMRADRLAFLLMCSDAFQHGKLIPSTSNGWFLKWYDKLLLCRNPRAAESARQTSGPSETSPITKYKTKPKSSLSPPPTQQFGVSLAFIKENNANMVGAIPPVVRQCVEFLSQPDALETEGIFRRSANMVVIKELQRSCNRGEQLRFRNDPHNAAVLLKTFFRDLEEPLLTFDLYDEIMDFQNWSARDKPRKVKILILERLPLDNYKLLKYVFQFLWKVQDRSCLNKMTTNNLAVVFGPNLAWPPNGQMSLLSIAPINNFTDFLLAHQESIFII